MAKWKYIVTDESYDLEGTNDSALALFIAQFQMVIDTETGMQIRRWDPEKPDSEIPPLHNNWQVIFNEAKQETEQEQQENNNG